MAAGTTVAAGVTGEAAVNPEVQRVNSECTQVIEVLVSNTTANVILYEYNGSTWESVYTCTGTSGRNGISLNKRDGDGCTPAGVFPVSFCFGINKPGTGLDFRAIVPGDIWVDDSASGYYNTLASAYTSGDWSSSEDIYKLCSETVSTALVFDFNGNGYVKGSPGLGSAVFFNGRGTPRNGTAGDIDIKSSDMTVILSHLKQSNNPAIDIHALTDGSFYS